MTTTKTVISTMYCMNQLAFVILILDQCCNCYCYY